MCRFGAPILIAAVAVAMAVPAQAADRKASIAIQPGPLSSALHELARQAGSELLFSEESVRGITVRGVRGNFSVETALTVILRGTGLAAKRAASGAYIIQRRDIPTLAAAGHGIPVPMEEAAVP